jgi:Tfp pilus assembly protein PilN
MLKLTTAMAKKKNQEINLLPQKEFEASTFGRILKWLVTTFRYIVISVEMVVMIAFLSRFYLDAKSADLIDSITQKQAVIASYQKFEEQFRSTQNKLKSFVKFTGNSAVTTPLVNDISSKIPSNITLTELNVNGEKLELTAFALDESSASNFINNLNSSNLLTNISLTEVTQKQGIQGIFFTITANLKDRRTNGS